MERIFLREFCPLNEGFARSINSLITNSYKLTKFIKSSLNCEITICAPRGAALLVAERVCVESGGPQHPV